MDQESSEHKVPPPTQSSASSAASEEQSFVYNNTSHRTSNHFDTEIYEDISSSPLKQDEDVAITSEIEEGNANDDDGNERNFEKITPLAHAN